MVTFNWGGANAAPQPDNGVTTITRPVILGLVFLSLVFFFLMAHGLNFLGIYLMPAVIAGMRNHYNKGAIFALNLLLGWSGIAWIAAFVCALTNPAPVRVIAA